MSMPKTLLFLFSEEKILDKLASPEAITLLSELSIIITIQYNIYIVKLRSGKILVNSLLEIKLLTRYILFKTRGQVTMCQS